MAMAEAGPASRSPATPCAKGRGRASRVLRPNFYGRPELRRQVEARGAQRSTSRRACVAPAMNICALCAAISTSALFQADARGTTPGILMVRSWAGRRITSKGGNYPAKPRRRAERPADRAEPGKSGSTSITGLFRQTNSERISNPGEKQMKVAFLGMGVMGSLDGGSSAEGRP